MKKNLSEKSLALHKKSRGKIEIKSKVKLKTKDDLSLAYTPGVGAVSSEIGKDSSKSWQLTNRANQVAIVSDGTAVLGLGDLGPEAAMPVMEGKAVIFKEFADIDAIPLCINTKNVNEIVNFCKHIEPSFGGINLEDISAPRCFEILERLENELNIPVFHDDQDGTAIVTLAALINACKATGKKIKNLKIVVNGAGAAGIAIARLLLVYGVKNIILLDSKGTVCETVEESICLNPLYQGTANPFAPLVKKCNPYKLEIAKRANLNRCLDLLGDAMAGADVFIGVSKGGLVTENMVKSMNSKPIVFAMANPTPEIMPDLAHNAGASIVGTGRSDFSNQINNALVFPGIFRGLLDNKILRVTTEMKISAAIALARSVKKPTNHKILPDITDKTAVKVISRALARYK